MKTLEAVSNIMTKNVIVLDLSDSINKAEKLFIANNIRHIPVVNQEDVVGIISYTDLMKVCVSEIDENDENIETTIYNQFSLEQIMTKNIVTIEAGASIREVAEIFASNHFRALPVVDEKKIVGIVTTTDLIKYFLSHFE